MAVLGAFYLGVGLMVLGGAGVLPDPLIAADLSGVGNPAPRWAALLAGAGMLLWAVMQRPAEKRAPVHAGEAGGASVRGQSGASRAEAVWDRRINTALGSRLGVVALALAAGLLELPTMLPYLGAIGILIASPLPFTASALALAGYALVMLVPALALLVMGRVAGRRLDAPLRAMAVFVVRASGEALWWVVGIAGFLAMRWGLGFLFPDALWNPFK
ncbi:GAP family protein [Paeniglutamicibacter cryotolerans]|uniref:GAP family protein n=1 Tax=Paeniglutamicibacter cryotolerans TaxID=670079 RepID=UPI002483DFDE|nr:GAP family protein [Paeniglutamicibacter cryotolerans]